MRAEERRDRRQRRRPSHVVDARSALEVADLRAQQSAARARRSVMPASAASFASAAGDTSSRRPPSQPNVFSK
jgi:hypothetical protein